jgi:outer membrane protein assembly factor BamB
VKDGCIMAPIDANTGQQCNTQERHNAQGSYYASPVAADGRIFLCSLDGKVTVVKAGGDAPEILHSADFKERIAATPALVGNQILIRTARTLFAFGQ